MNVGKKNVNGIFLCLTKNIKISKCHFWFILNYAGYSSEKKIINEKLSKPSKKIFFLFVPPSYVGSHIANVEHEKIINFIQKNFNHNNFDTEMLHIFFPVPHFYFREHIYIWLKWKYFEEERVMTTMTMIMMEKVIEVMLKFFFVRNLELG